MCRENLHWLQKLYNKAGYNTNDDDDDDDGDDLKLSQQADKITEFWSSCN